MKKTYTLPVYVLYSKNMCLGETGECKWFTGVKVCFSLVSCQKCTLSSQRQWRSAQVVEKMDGDNEIHIVSTKYETNSNVQDHKMQCDPDIGLCW